MREVTARIEFYRGYSVGEVIEDDHYSNDKRLTLNQSKELRDKLINDKKKKGEIVTPQDGFAELSEDWGKDILSILKYSPLSDIERDIYDGRPCFVLKINPAPSGKYGNDSFVRKIKGRIWIDEQSQFVIKIDVSGTWKFKDKAGKTVEVPGFPFKIGRAHV